MAKKITKNSIKKSLIEQLEKRGASSEVFTNLIEDYLSLWEMKEELKKDIKTRGIVYETTSAVGAKIEKNNPSNKELLATNKQMLSILKDLGITTSTVIADDEDL